jgi:Kef-type K+ transport system membrane component KefB
MRRVASLFALGVVMALLHRATASGPLEARATLALAFLLLAAYLGGDVARQVRLPRITGYILVGFAAGPAWLGLVRREEVEALGFLRDAALTLIALTVGSTLRLAELRGDRLALTRVAAGAVAFPFVVVSLVALSVTPWLPFTAHQPLGDRVAVSLVLGTLAAASSPVITMAMLEELEPSGPGPLARGLLGVTVAQDLAVVVLFALVIALSKTFASAGAVSLAVAGVALGGLFASLAVGLLLGYAVHRALGLMRRDAGILLLAVAFVAPQAAHLAHLDTLIIALAAGLYLANVAPEADRLRTELQRGSTVVYAVFCTLSGAGMHVGILADWWPWALLLIGLRAVSLRYGVLWAGRHPSVSAGLARAGWLALISQLGMAAVLAQLARRAFPEWGVSLETLLVAMIGVHTVAGPICFRMALERAGEITGRSGGGGGSRDAEGSMGGGGVVASGGGL